MEKVLEKKAKFCEGHCVYTMPWQPRKQIALRWTGIVPSPVRFGSVS